MFQKLTTNFQNLVHKIFANLTEVKNSSKNLTSYLPILTLTLAATFAATNLHSLPTSADDHTSTITINVEPACTLSNDTDSSQTAKTLQPGTYDDSIHTFTLTSNCNHIYDSQIFAIGYSNNENGNTNLIGSTTNELIPGTTAFENDPTDFTASGWFMKVSPDETDIWQFTPQNGFNNFHTIPNESTLIAKTNITTDRIAKPTSSLTTVYATYASATQAADTYEGKVKYTLLSNPSTLAKYYMQDLTLSSISALLPSINDSVTVYDKRDEKPYTIAKLADGNYWMTSNLNLAGGTSLYSDTSDVPAGYISTPYYTLPESATFTDGNNIPNDQFSNDATAYVFNTGNETTNCTASTPCNSYYSYVAATAGSGADITARGYNAGYSICPAGWRLPTATISNADAQADDNWKTGDFYKLGAAYDANLESFSANTDAFFNNAGPGTVPNFLLSGSYSVGSFSGGNTDGRYWASTAYSGTYAYNLWFYSTNVNFTSYRVHRRVGFAVRCIFGSNTMQTVTSSGLAETIPNNGDTTELIDSRNGASYSIKNINGTYWMTTNLALGKDTTMQLTSADTNLAPGTTYNLPASSASGFSDNAAENIYNAGFQTCSSSQPCYGYYTYAAATAGTNPSSGNAEYDICPKGWRLPTQSEYAALADNYNTGSSLVSNWSAVYSGNYNSSSFRNGGTYGSYWASTANQIFGFNESAANIRYDGKFYGFSIRCVAKS